ncbi:transcriptional regulator [Rhodococcus sp. WS4]|nr:transcriptional regulator [Rhodococcus sp. WS4]
MCALAWVVDARCTDASRGSELKPNRSPSRLDGIRDCPIADAAQVIGNRQTILVIREIFYGSTRFSDIQRHTGLSRDILADRMRSLEKDGIVIRRMYMEHPPRFDYVLSEIGHELWPVLEALRTWGTEYSARGPRESTPE